MTAEELGNPEVRMKLENGAYKIVVKRFDKELVISTTTNKITAEKEHYMAWLGIEAFIRLEKESE